MFRKLLSLLLAVLLLCCATAVLADEPKKLTNTDGFVYIIKDDDSAEIVGYTGQQSQIDIPAAIDGHPVSSLGRTAFSAISTLQELHIPGNVKSIGFRCFEFCDNLKTVSIDEGVEKIELGAFYGCSKLENINIPNSAVLIKSEAFSFCDKLETISLPADHPELELIDGVLFSRSEKKLLWYPYLRKDKVYTVPEGTLCIGEFAISSKYIEKVILPDSLTKLESNALCGPKLKEFNIPPLVTEIYIDDIVSMDRITVDEKNEVFESIDGVLFNKATHKLVAYPKALKAKEYSVPEETEIIGSNAFYANPTLVKIQLPGSVREVESNAFFGAKKLKTVFFSEGLTSLSGIAFQHCGNLTEVNIPYSLTEIDGNPFVGCTKLKELNIPEDHSRFTIMDSTLVDKEKMVLLWYPLASKAKSFRVPEGIKVIGSGAFSGCKSLNEVIIPEGVEKLEWSCFSDARKIKRFVLPASLTEIDKTAFDATFNNKAAMIDATYVVVRGSYAENFCQSYEMTIEYAE